MTLEKFSETGFNLNKFIVVETPSFQYEGAFYTVKAYRNQFLRNGFLEDLNSDKYYYAFYPQENDNNFRIVKLSKLFNDPVKILREKFLKYYIENEFRGI